MERRRFLTVSGVGAALGLGGCLTTARDLAGDTHWKPEVDGSEPEVTPGEEATLTINANDVAAIQIYTSARKSISINPNIDDASVSPTPYTQLDADPPYWV